MMMSSILATVLKNKTNESKKIRDFDGIEICIPSVLFAPTTSSKNTINSDNHEGDTKKEEEILPCKYDSRTKKRRTRCVFVPTKNDTKKEDKNVVLEKSKLQHLDSTVLLCSNPYCCTGCGFKTKNIKETPTSSSSSSHPTTSTISPGTFHASCYLQMINDSSGLKEHIIKREYDPTNLAKKIQELVLPVCSLLCYKKTKQTVNTFDQNTNKESSRISKIRAAIESNNSDMLPRWDEDQVTENGPTSISILLKWICTEENGLAYLGAKDTKTGNTKGKTKESYHQKIARYIRQETGMYI